MPVRRKYSNATFTKRVDHEGGRHRPSRAISEPAVCKECGAVYAGRRWTGARSTTSQDEHLRAAQITLCPACKQQRTGEPRGFVFLDGDFFKLHGEEIEQLLRNEAKRLRFLARKQTSAGYMAARLTSQAGVFVKKCNRGRPF